MHISLEWMHGLKMPTDKKIKVESVRAEQIYNFSYQTGAIITVYSLPSQPESVKMTNTSNSALFVTPRLHDTTKKYRLVDAWLEQLKDTHLKNGINRASVEIPDLETKSLVSSWDLSTIIVVKCYLNDN